jgi:hypothetical protein
MPRTLAPILIKGLPAIAERPSITEIAVFADWPSGRLGAAYRADGKRQWMHVARQIDVDSLTRHRGDDTRQGAQAHNSLASLSLYTNYYYYTVSCALISVRSVAFIK